MNPRFINLKKRLKEEILVLDGAMGTILLDRGIKSKTNESLNITHPKIIQEIHEQYINAGADIIETNTFGANYNKLKKYKLSDKVKKINTAAIRIAHQAIKNTKNNTFIAGSMGPLPDYIYPLGKTKFEDAYKVYKEQITSLKGCDFLLLETISDIKTAKAAIFANQDSINLPMFVSFTFQDKHTTLGTDIETFANIISNLNVVGLGMNCSSGPEDFKENIKTLAKLTNLPLIIYPNAGLPKIQNKHAIYDYPPRKFANHIKNFVKSGANIVGGCCGTTPAFINEIKYNTQKLKPKKREIKYISKVSSRTKTLSFTKPLIAGDRINPTGRKDIASDLRKNRINLLQKEAINQQAAGANLLDLNLGLPDINEKELLTKALEQIQENVEIPIIIDSTKISALEKALQNSNGRPIINSVNASKDSLKKIFPLAKKYGALVFGLTLNEKNIPKTIEGRIKLAKQIISYGEKYIHKDDIIIDPLIGTISVEIDRAITTLKTLSKLSELKIKTNLGISNVSHGLPDRETLNSNFLTMALQSGLSICLFNPYEKKTLAAFHGTNAIINKDLDTYLHNHKTSKSSIKNQITKAVIEGNPNIDIIIKDSLQKNSPEAINEMMLKGLQIVGKQFAKKKIFLPHLIESAKTTKKGFDIIKPKLPKLKGKSKGTILFATVKGDVHDIGKNVVINMLESNNFKVIDLGVDVSSAKIIKMIKKYNPIVIGLSALMTSTAGEMETIVKNLKMNKINIPIMIGGAVVNNQYANKIHATYAKDAIKAIEKIHTLTK